MAAQGRYCELPVLLGLLAALHFGVPDFARLDQRRNAGMGQVVAVFVHAVSQAFAFDPPLAAKLLLVLHAMLPHVLARRAKIVVTPTRRASCPTLPFFGGRAKGTNEQG